ncbi:MAG: cation:proton antiporter domain-containing protein, partial [Flavipsychrobacter sp.]
MALGSYTIIIILSTVVILSYIFSLISRKTNIPSVLLLIASGIALKELMPIQWHYEAVVNKLVKILGAIGLIMIVLEAALDLKINRGKIKLIRNSFSSALFIFLISAFGIGLLIMQQLGVPLENAFIYAVPLSIISSSVAIPSAERLPEEKREFVIYESSFSDILGILLFNYLLMDDVLSLKAVGVFFGNVGLAIIISIIASLLLIYTLTQSKTNIRFFLVFAILALIYSLGEQIHLPSLLIVLVFGLVFNNNELILRGRLKT